MKLKSVFIISCFAFAGVAMQGQVTIGSAEKPVSGALLDLKQYNDQEAKDGGRTADKGLGMPRVALQSLTGDLGKSLDASETQNGTLDADKHTGLLVYHTEKCTLAGKGLYVWTGTEWQPLHEYTPAGVSFNKDYFDLPSGRDKRPLTAQTLTVNWTGATAPTGTLPINNIPGIAVPGTIGASPFDISLLPTAMTINPTSPWQSKESIMRFTDPDCGGTKDVTLNQTNYALKVNNQFSDSQITYTTATTGTFPVQGNSRWTATLASDPNNVIASTNPAFDVVSGKEITDGTTLSPNFEFTTNASQKYHSADITFKDTASIARFDPITVSILNCNNTNNEPTIEQWAERIGYTTAEITAVTDAQGGSSVIKNGYQLHRDQDNQLFISSDFGSTAGRWMIHNVRAKTYAATGRTDGTTVISPNSIANSYSNVYNNPQWSYPNIDGTTNASLDTEYSKSNRLGLLYNWAAATMKKGGSNGQANFTEGETTGGTHEGQAQKVQGICPNGWHVPSDWEWTQLEMELDANTSKYSGTPDANKGITIGAGSTWRGSTHGTGMKDPCPVPGITIASEGSSNVISKNLSGGFNVMLAGYANGSAAGYGSNAYFWSGSGVSTNNAWCRLFGSGTATVYRGYGIRDIGFSVRCKKDN